MPDELLPPTVSLVRAIRAARIDHGARTDRSGRAGRIAHDYMIRSYFLRSRVNEELTPLHGERTRYAFGDAPRCHTVIRRGERARERRERHVVSRPVRHDKRGHPGLCFRDITGVETPGVIAARRRTSLDHRDPRRWLTGTHSESDQGILQAAADERVIDVVVH